MLPSRCSHHLYHPEGLRATDTTVGASHSRRSHRTLDVSTCAWTLAVLAALSLPSVGVGLFVQAPPSRGSGRCHQQTLVARGYSTRTDELFATRAHTGSRDGINSWRGDCGRPAPGNGVLPGRGGGGGGSDGIRFRAVRMRLPSGRDGGDFSDAGSQQQSPAVMAGGIDGPETSATVLEAPALSQSGTGVGVDDGPEQGERRGWGGLWRGNKKQEEQETEPESSSSSSSGGRKRRGLFTYDWKNGSRVKWIAGKRSSAIVEEGGRKLSDYLALPPTEYSLLDPKMITRLTEDTFRMDCGTLNIVGTKVNPVLFVRVDVQPEQSQANIMVERVELGGSEAVRSAGGTFNVTSSTVVSSAEAEDTGDEENMLQLRTRADIEIEMLVPNENFVPLGVLRRAGSFVMQRVLDIGLPQFTKFLKRDYARWAEGNDDRTAVATDGESLIAVEEE